MKTNLDCVILSKPVRNTYKRKTDGKDQTYLTLEVNELPDNKEGPVNRWSPSVFATGLAFDLKDWYDENRETLAKGEHYVRVPIVLNPMPKKDKDENGNTIVPTEKPAYKERSSFTAATIDGLPELVKITDGKKDLVARAIGYEVMVEQEKNKEANAK